MRLNRKGMTGIADAMFFVILIGLAVTIVAANSTLRNDDGIAEPSSVCGTLFQSELTTSDLGMPTKDPMVHPLPVLTALSMKNGDGCAAAYIGGFLDTVYPWNNAYRMELSTGGLAETIGGGDGSPGRSFAGEYSTIYGETLFVTLHIFVR